MRYEYSESAPCLVYRLGFVHVGALWFVCLALVVCDCLELCVCWRCEGECSPSSDSYDSDDCCVVRGCEGEFFLGWVEVLHCMCLLSRRHVWRCGRIEE